jgi:hypothetical protein
MGVIYFPGVLKTALRSEPFGTGSRTARAQGSAHSSSYNSMDVKEPNATSEVRSLHENCSVRPTTGALTKDIC